MQFRARGDLFHEDDEYMNEDEDDCPLRTTVGGKATQTAIINQHFQY